MARSTKKKTAGNPIPLSSLDQENEHCILVCVTRQRTCERLILHGVELAKAENLPLCVVNVTLSGQPILGNSAEGEALDYLYQIASDNGAEAVMLKSDHVSATLAQYAKRRKARFLIMGESPSKSERNFSQEMQALLPDTHILTL